MIKKPTPYVNNPGTTSDSVLREVSDLYGKSIRVSDAHSVIDRYFSHFRADYDIKGNPTRVKYYQGLQARSTAFTLGMAATLGGKYFKLFTAPDNHLVTVWFNLDGANSQPTIPNTFRYIEISLNSSDDSYMLGLALKMVIDGLYPNYFYTVLDDGLQIQIITSQMGECSPSESGTSGFVFTQVAGSQELVQDIEILYNGKDPFYNGQVLKNYRFNVFTGKFEHKEEPVDVLWDEIITTLPSNTTELYTYKLNSVIVQTILVTYQTASKSLIISIQKTGY